MAADPPGATTDDHGPAGTGGDPTPVPGGVRATTAAGTAPAGGASPVPPPPDARHPTRSPVVDPAPERAGAPTASGGPAADEEGRVRDRAPGRHVANRRSRGERAPRGLRVDQRVWSIDPWSVLKLSALFYLCVGLIVVVAGTLLYNVGRTVGTLDQFESFVTRMGAYGECVPAAEVPEGKRFVEDEENCDDGEVLVGGFVLDDGLLFRAAAIGSVILVIAGTVGNVLLAVLLNLLNEVTGGLRHTVIREPARPPAGTGPGRAPVGPGPADTLPNGSPAPLPRE